MTAVNERGRQKIMRAASTTPIDNDYDAAILGGIVRALIDKGQMDMQLIRHYVPSALGWFDGTRRETHYLPATDMPTAYMATSRAMPAVERIKEVSRRFITQYEPGSI